ncbi:Rha family transcriptional regulator [Limosilactobacillus reuteri]|uniref:Rha family transcriptional regulator n=1 Tax=Limosilactobacillus reuteri TaxID=1598 RepID=UPI001E37974A|nr:Rha family transcriptional regulator [Limosilactobacillus reuteri]MCC4372691.1 Rha family transcriptional regulator [Limosilactobacillus reuteri]
MDAPQLLNFRGEPTLDSREVAKMIGKRHKNLIRDIRQYINDLDEGSKLSSPKFFIESNYKSSQGKLLPCYLLTKMGCEFVANKMTGKKGTLFTAQYVSLFNEYQEEHKAIDAHMISDEIALRNRELSFKERWLGEMEAQNANKRAELLIKLANHSTKAPLRNDLLNEAMNQLMMPVVGEKAFPAGVIADELGVSAYTIGIWGQRLGLKAPKGMANRYGYWKDNRYYYNELAVQNFYEHQAAIVDDEF